LKYFSISSTYISNFTPNTSFNKNFKFKKTNKIICKNFIVFFMLMKHIVKKTNISFFIKPIKRSNITILRSPYRHKLSRHQITFNRFFLIMKFKIAINNSIVIKNINIIKILQSMSNFFKFFETNICNQHKIKIVFDIKSNFEL